MPIAAGWPRPSTVACADRRSIGGSAWKAALIEPRVEPSFSEMSTIRAEPTVTRRASTPTPDTAPMIAPAATSSETPMGFATRPNRIPNRRNSHPATNTTNTMSTAFRIVVNVDVKRANSMLEE